MQKPFMTSLAILTFALALPAFADEAAVDDAASYEDHLLGDVGGLRGELYQSGVDVTVEYKADTWANVSGGIKRGSNYLDNLDVKFALDNEKLLGLKGNRALIYFLDNNGGKPNAHQVGSTQGIDNIEVGANTAKLYEAWMEQSFLDDKVAVLVGLHDLNSEFMVNDMTANFIKPVFQVNQEFAQTGKNGPSIFPNTSVAGRVKYTPSEESYVMAAAFDGVPGNPDHPHGTHIDFNTGDGLLLIAEAGLTPKAPDQGNSTPNKFALGAWMYTSRFDDLVVVDASGNPVKRRSQGLYLLSSYQFFHDKEEGHDLGVFFRGGKGDGNTRQVDWFYAAGLVGNGWMPARPDSEIGAGFTQSHNGDKYVQSVVASGGRADRSEYGLTFYYRDKLCNGISVEPNVEYIINPGSNPAVGDATVLGVRFDVNF